MVTRTYVRTGDSIPFYKKGDKIVMDDDFPIPSGWTREDQLLSINQLATQVPPFAKGELVECIHEVKPFYTLGYNYIVDKYDPPFAGGKGIVWTTKDDTGAPNALYEDQFRNLSRVTVAMSVGGSGILQKAVNTTVPTGSPKKQSSRRLSSLGEKVKSEFDSLYAKQGCTCDALVSSDKCPHCIHPGNPRNIDFFSDYWEAVPAKSRADEIWDAITQAAGKGNT